MASYRATVASPLMAAEAFSYMADLRNFELWDPGVRGVRQVEGAGGGPTSVFDVTIAGVGRPMVLRYRTVGYVAPESIVVESTNRFITSTDRITIVAATAGCRVTYDAQLQLNGPLRALDCLAKIVLNRIGHRAAAGLRRALHGEETS